MPEDAYDFEGLNPSRLLPLDKGAQPFDYETHLSQKGYTHKQPFELGELFKALGTEYVPSVVIDLPPRVVERRQIIRPLFTFLSGWLQLWGTLFGLFTIGAFFLVSGAVLAHSLSLFAAIALSMALSGVGLLGISLGPAVEALARHVRNWFET